FQLGEFVEGSTPVSNRLMFVLRSLEQRLCFFRRCGGFFVAYRSGNREQPPPECEGEQHRSATSVLHDGQFPRSGRGGQAVVARTRKPARVSCCVLPRCVR